MSTRGGSMRNFVSEMRSSLRGLLKDYRATAAGAATLAVGIGASTAIFTVVYAVLLRPLPYPSPERIVQVWQTMEGGKHGGQLSDANFRDLKDRNRSLSAFAEYATVVVSVSGGKEPLRARSAIVSSEFFDALGVKPFLGRPFDDDELREGGAPAVLVGYGFWQRALGGSPDLSAQKLFFSGSVHSVVGVMPRNLDFPTGTDVWVPRELYPRLPSRTAHNWRAIARLADGVSFEAAASDLSAIARDLRATYGEDTWMIDAEIVPLHEELVGNARTPLVVLLGAVGFLLLVASANVVNLLLARAASRQREVAVRAALGANRWQMLRMFLTESLLLTFAGGSLGVLLAFWGVPLLVSLEPGNLPRLGEIGVSLPVLGFALALGALVSFGLGLVTALRSTRSGRGLGSHLRERSGGGGGARLARLRSGLVVSQIALTLVLLVGSGLLARSLVRLLDVDPGFRRTSALVVDLSHPDPADESEKKRLGQTESELLARLAGLPGVRRAGLIDLLPLTTGIRNGTFLVVSSLDEVKSFEDFGRLMKDPSKSGTAEYRAASAGFFETMGIPLVRGRLFEPSDSADAPHVALVSETLAEEKWPGEDPIGKLIEFGNMDGDLRFLRVVGIVGDVLQAGLDAKPRSTVYVDASQRPPSDYSVVLELGGDPASVATATRAIVRELLPDVPPRFRTIEEVLSDSISGRRFNVVLLGAFGVAALLLAVFGIYGVISYGVAERTREIGLRLALGARPADVSRLIVGQGSRLVVLGLAFGVVFAVGLSRLLTSLLFGVGATDPLTFVGLALVLGAIALVACYVPARRASRVDPMISLRYE
jgi:putative ABC transport system permease protein